jgi:hypothetical protein
MSGQHHLLDLAALGSAWNTSWPDCPPVAPLLRRRFPGRSVRFHTLPAAKRYATSATEHAEILRRHHVLLAEVFEAANGAADGSLAVITCSWSATSQPTPRDAAVAAITPGAVYWRSHDLATEPGFHSWQHHYASPLGLRDPALDQLLLCVADDMTDGVILTNHTADWAFHPYDGGAEVFAPNAEAGDQLSATYADWAVPISPEK